MARAAKLDDTAWADLCAQLSWSDIRDVQRATRGLAEHDYDSLALMTVAAARRWALDDLKKIVAIEQRVLATVPEAMDRAPELWPEATKELEVKLLQSGARLFKGFVDLIIGDDVGRTVVDWKTAGDVGPSWRERLRCAWQGRLYCWAGDAQRFTFRGVQRDGRTAEVSVDWPMRSQRTGNVIYGNSDCEFYLRNAFAIRESQTGHPWAQNRQSCHAFGRDCERLESCNEKTMPAGIIGNEPLSNSSIDLLLLCPERYRQSRLLADDDRDDDKRTALGRAFHSGIEQLYTQLRRLG